MKPPATFERLISADEVDLQHPVSRTTRWRMIKAGQFPSPVRISRGRVAWRESEVVRWLAERERVPK